MQKTQAVVSLVTSVLFLFGCSKENTINTQKEVFPGLGIIHGMEIPDDVHPETVKVTTGSGLCTGVFVNENPPTLLTASHCLASLPSAKANDGGVKYAGVKSRRACVPDGAVGHVNPFDMAVVVFAAGSVQVPGVATIASVDPESGAAVTLVGFGRNTGLENVLKTGAGKKRLGINAVNRIVDTLPKTLLGMIELKAAVEGDLTQSEIEKEHDSGPNHGDSGGPLFLNIGRNTELVGLVSGGHVKEKVSTGYYTNLRMEKNRAFLSKALDSTFLDAMAKADTPADYTDICAVTK